MQIQLKQSEIVDALKQYITKQGFNLSGKSVDVMFTAGRGTTGLSADLVIEEQTDLPLALTGDESEVEVTRPVLTVVATAEGVSVTADPVSQAPAADAAPATEKKTSSLFA